MTQRRGRYLLFSAYSSPAEAQSTAPLPRTLALTMPTVRGGFRGFSSACGCPAEPTSEPCPEPDAAERRSSAWPLPEHPLPEHPVAALPDAEYPVAEYPVAGRDADGPPDATAADPQVVNPTDGAARYEAGQYEAGQYEAELLASG